MPYSRPSLSGLRDLALQDINAAQIVDAQGNRLDGTLPRSIMRVLAYAIAGQGYELYSYLDWISREAVPATATDEFLAAWGALKGVSRGPATYASGLASLSGTVNTVVPAGTVLQRADNVSYATTGAVSIGVSGSVAAPILATVAGSGGNAPAGVGLSLASPIGGVNGTGAAQGPIQGGNDVESDDRFRTRVLQVYANPPQGGSRNDYLEWAMAVAGVTRAWINPTGGGAGTVLLYVMLDAAEAAYGGFPQGANGVAANESRAAAATGDQLTVANAILPVQPVTALVYVLAPVNSPVAFTVADLGANNTPTMQAAISVALSDMFLREANVGGTVDPSTGALWPAIEPAAWYAALSAIPGLSSFRVAVPNAALAAPAGSLFSLGPVTFQS